MAIEPGKVTRLTIGRMLGAHGAMPCNNHEDMIRALVDPT